MAGHSGSSAKRLAALFSLAVLSVRGAPSTPQEQIAAMLDDWHQAASVADEARYFSHFAPNGVFMGTDATERWTVSEFRKWAKPRFQGKSAWSFRAHDRHISFSRDGATAWFDEMLDTPNLGPCRGSGVVVIAAGGWEIAQYNLSIPIPNALAPAVVKEVGKELAKPKGPPGK